MPPGQNTAAARASAVSKTVQDAASSLPSQDSNAKHDAVSNLTLCVAYDGEEMREAEIPHMMNVRDLAPALIAFSDLVEETNKLLHGNDAPAVQVRITPDFQPGSFEVSLHIAQGPIVALLDLFSTPRLSGLANLFDVLIGGPTIGVSVFAAIRWIKNRKIQKTEILADGDIQITIEGGKLVIKRDVAKVLGDLSARRFIEAVLAPLRRKEIDVFEIRKPRTKAKRDKSEKPIERVIKEEVPVFEAPPPLPQQPPQQVTCSTYEKVFTIVSLTFKDGNKWKLSDGNNPIGVTIEDVDFLTRVNNREAVFAKDDMIRCSVRQEQISSADGLRTNYAITKVLEHTHAPRQILLPMPTEPQKAD